MVLGESFPSLLRLKCVRDNMVRAGIGTRFTGARARPPGSKGSMQGRSIGGSAVSWRGRRTRRTGELSGGREQAHLRGAVPKSSFGLKRARRIWNVEQSVR